MYSLYTYNIICPSAIGYNVATYIYIDPLPIVADVFNILKIILNGNSAKADGTNKTLICFFSLKNFSDRLGLSILLFITYS